jgi:hypothetical protein
MLLQTENGLASVLRGRVTPVPAWEGIVEFEFDGFSFLMREDYTTNGGD